MLTLMTQSTDQAPPQKAPRKKRAKAKSRLLPSGAKPRATLNTEEQTKLRLETMCATRTILLWAAGHRMRQATSIRLERAAKKLGIPLQP